MSYAFSALTINNRQVSFESILSSKVEALTDFERTTFEFIRGWFSNTEEFVLQTSGSTGPPKKIVITRTQMVHSARRTMAALDVAKNDTAFVCLNTQYIAGKMMLVRALTCDLRIVAAEPSSNPFETLGDQTRLHFAAFVPLQLQRVLDLKKCLPILDQMKAILVGGGAVSESLKEATNVVKCPVFATYGMTETASNIALQRLNGSESSRYFRALEEIMLSKGENGCLVVRVPEIADPVITNDLIELIDDKTFRWLGRRDNIINTSGIKVLPEEIEAVIQQEFNRSNINCSFFVGGIPDNRYGESVALFVESRNLSASDLKKISEIVYYTPVTFQKPRFLIGLEAFEFTKSGKIERKATIEVYLSQALQIHKMEIIPS